MNYTFPPTTFSRTNSQSQQVRHILSECAEVIDAMIAHGGIIVGNVEAELMDLTHSLETFWRMREESHGEHHVAGIVAGIVAKNRARGYYNAD